MEIGVTLEHSAYAITIMLKIIILHISSPGTRCICNVEK
jgi:hypothetical protein